MFYITATSYNVYFSSDFKNLQEDIINGAHNRYAVMNRLISLSIGHTFQQFLIIEFPK